MQAKRAVNGAVLVALIALAVPAAGWAQTTEVQRQRDLETTHSVLQKTGLGTIAVTGALGLVLFANKPTIFGDGLCSTGAGIFGEYGCGGGLAITHLVFAVASLGLFVSEEIVAAKMNPSPYEIGDARRRDVMSGLRWTEVGLYAVQPVLGLLAAHPGLIGIPASSRVAFSRVLRTVHLGVGLGVATTYTLNAALQW